MTKDIILKKNPDMVTRRIDKNIMLVPVLKTSEDINCIYSLNDTASFVWDLIDGKKTLGVIETAVLKKFDATKSDVEKKMGKLIDDLKKINAVLM